jgi:3-oxoadipate enol-lactonase
VGGAPPPAAGGAPGAGVGGAGAGPRAMWDPKGRARAGRFRVVRYDHRGHGGSPVPPGPYTLANVAGDVLGLLDRLGIERASFCGLSLGGMVGMWLAANAPERFDRLVLCCSAPELDPGAWSERGATVRAHWRVSKFGRITSLTSDRTPGSRRATPSKTCASCPSLARGPLRILPTYCI